MMTAESKNPGPVLWLTACGHGDEVGGIVIIQEIFKIIKKYGIKKGAIHAFPLMNPIGFENIIRHISPSKEDLNRSFPGNKNGSLAERIAFIIFESIKQTHPTLVIDLHNDWKNSIPYCLIDPVVLNNDISSVINEYAWLTGFPLIMDTDILIKSLSHNLVRSNIPAITLEVGESYIVNEKNVTRGIRAILNILNKTGVLEYGKEEFQYPNTGSFKNMIFNYSEKPLCSTTGIIRFTSKPGEWISKGRIFAKIYNAFGKLQEHLCSIDNALILGHTDSSVAFPGLPVMSFGISKE